MSHRLAGFCAAAAIAATCTLAAQTPPAGPWRFLVSGDARNCGDVVMPAIAEIAKRQQVNFYWHLGDLRFVSNFDEDIQHQPAYLQRPWTVSQYLAGAWPDFIASQIAPFGGIRFMLGIGNHELLPPHTREEFIIQFADWLNTPLLRDQRLADDPLDHRVKTYYHWIENGIDFIFLDNATNEEVTAVQLSWFAGVLQRASADAAVHTIVVGMHKALPGGYNTHSMDESPAGVESGQVIYAALLKAQKDAHKRVYVLASHEHLYMDNAYDTPYWREHGGVLPGWVVGTGGATRYPLPDPSPKGAMTNVYGALLGTAQPNGGIEFSFQRVNEGDIPAAVTARYGAEFVHWCFAQNTIVR